MGLIADEAQWMKELVNSKTQKKTPRIKQRDNWRKDRW